MSAVAKAVPTPRYGSAAELAAYAGLSPKTIRRLVEARAIRGFKVGRRLLIAYEDLDRHVHRIADHRPRTQERPTMAIAPTPSRPGAVDPETGRLLPVTEEQRKERSAKLAAAIARRAQTTDASDTDEVWREVFRGIDESRPHRPLFEGQY
jgi:excisionase family DNA binding protein